MQKVFKNEIRSFNMNKEYNGNPLFRVFSLFI